MSKEPMKEEMQKRLIEWFNNFGNHPVGLKDDFNDEELIKFFLPHKEAYQAIRRLIENQPEKIEWGQIHCSNCGQAVSSKVPKGTVVKAWIECENCVEKEKSETKITDEELFEIKAREYERGFKDGQS